MHFGLNQDGTLWVRRPDDRLMESLQETAARAEAEADRAREASARAERLAAKLREPGLDPDSL
jgi:hypothetical protein